VYRCGRGRRRRVIRQSIAALMNYCTIKEKYETMSIMTFEIENAHNITWKNMDETGKEI
jgi:hypothetical protein